MKKIRYENSKGFTLLELLTVIAIIGILTAILTFSYITVRQRARDTQRKSDVKQIQSALELYRSDNDSYPISTTSNPFTSGTCGQVFSYNNVQYMPKIPCDPQNTTTPYYYYQPNAGGTSYALVSCLENTNDTKDGTASAPSWWSNFAGIATWSTLTTTLSCPSATYYAVTNP